jgi:hypothetical protein
VDILAVVKKSAAAEVQLSGDTHAVPFRIRQFLGFVDGKRTVAELLSTTSTYGILDAPAVLGELQARGLIEVVDAAQVQRAAAVDLVPTGESTTGLSARANALSGVPAKGSPVPVQPPFAAGAGVPVNPAPRAIPINPVPPVSPARPAGNDVFSLDDLADISAAPSTISPLPASMAPRGAGAASSDFSLSDMIMPQAPPRAPVPSPVAPPMAMPAPAASSTIDKPMAELKFQLSEYMQARLGSGVDKINAKINAAASMAELQQLMKGCGEVLRKFKGTRGYEEFHAKFANFAAAGSGPVTRQAPPPPDIRDQLFDYLRRALGKDADMLKGKIAAAKTPEQFYPLVRGCARVIEQAQGPRGLAAFKERFAAYLK